MELYVIAGLTTVTALMGLIGFRLAKDELLLRRKRLMISNYQILQAILSQLVYLVPLVKNSSVSTIRDFPPLLSPILDIGLCWYYPYKIPQKVAWSLYYELTIYSCPLFIRRLQKSQCYTAWDFFFEYPRKCFYVSSSKSLGICAPIF